jgi:DNA-binding transcriptional LysR family regulator
MNRLDDIEAFVSVVDEGSLTAAARRLRRSLQSISRSLATLEQSVGVELVRRTTRQSRPTEAGTAFYRRVKPALLEITEAKLEAADQQIEPSGLLRIGAPVLFAPTYLVPVIAAFMQRYQDIEVELELSDSFVDLSERNLDLAVRIGELPDSDLKAKPLGTLRRVAFGAPAYFAKHGRPRHPRELAQHRCVVRTAGGNDAKWPFLVDGKLQTVRVKGTFRTDSTAALYAAASLGLGIGFTPLWQIRSLVDQGKVELILSKFEPPPVPIRIVWSASKVAPAKTRLFTDFIAKRLKLERL